MTQPKSVLHNVCPCCGQQWALGRSKMDAKRLIYSFLTTNGTRKARLLECMADHFGEWIPRSGLVAAVYHDDPDGGPLGATESVAVALSQLRKKLAPLGLEIEGKSWCGSRLRWSRDKTGGNA